MLTKINIVELPYYNDGARCFSHFAHLPFAVFLDGGQPFNQQERYNIIAACPQQVITPSSSTDIFAKTRTYLHQLKSKIDIPDKFHQLPFKIGALGYLSYDLSYSYFSLKRQSINDITLPQAIMGIYDWTVIIDHHEQKTWLFALSKENINYVKAQLSLNTSMDPFYIKDYFQSNMTFEEYSQAFKKIKQHIRQGDCYQINLCQRWKATYRGSPWDAYQYLRKINPTPFSAYININNRQAILCFSPERFLRVNNRQVETKPIKGTAPRFANPIDDKHSAEALLTSTKDLAENLMIVDLLRNDLGKCCKPGSIRVPKLAALESFPNVHHLVSTVIGELQDNQEALDLLKHCFPGGSITGAPKLRAMQIIEGLEPQQRSIYCGSIAYLDVDGNLDCNIAIRTLICDSPQIYCYAGGGIVADSTLKREYEETQIKVGKLIQALLDKSRTSTAIPS